MTQTYFPTKSYSFELANVVDMHCHILPFIDDGPSDWQESLKMASQAALEGITAIIATPHHVRGRYMNPGNRVKELVNEFNERLMQERIPLTVLPGQEVHIHRELLEELESGSIIGLGHSRYILIELPANQYPVYFEEMVHELKLMGFVPVIAHPERNAVLGQDLDLLESLIEMGALVQITTHSLIGGFGKRIQRHSGDMMKRKLVHFLASDAHGMDKRTFEYRNAYERVVSKYGWTCHNNLVHNASLLIDHPLIYNAGGS